MILTAVCCRRTGSVSGAIQCGALENYLRLKSPWTQVFPLICSLVACKWLKFELSRFCWKERFVPKLHTCWALLELCTIQYNCVHHLTVCMYVCHCPHIYRLFAWNCCVCFAERPLRNCFSGLFSVLGSMNLRTVSYWDFEEQPVLGLLRFMWFPPPTSGRNHSVATAGW